jgi:hypothetical protein
MKYLTLSLLFILASCDSMDPEPHFIEPALRPAVIEFMTVAATYGITVDTSSFSVRFNDQMPYRGIAHHGKRLIEVYPSFREQEMTLWHELGHLVLHREHNDAVMPEDERIPYSIMHPQLTAHFGERSRYRQHYMDELFKR